MKDKHRYEIKLTPKQLDFLVQCIDIAQRSQSINPDNEQLNLVRDITKKYEDYEDRLYGDEYGG